MLQSQLLRFGRRLASGAAAVRCSGCQAA
ncbi:MAG: hypothetical protein KAT29_05770 [Anaerolineales bacterium]|nr:hypothetical protein [Anaerolineales bacterium]